MNIGLLVIDVQKAFIGELKDTKVYNETLMFINAATNLFRSARLPVIVIRDLSEGDGPEFDNVAEFESSKTDIEVIKYHSNAFWQTNLDQLLKDKGIDFLILCGNAAEYCVLATYNGALERGYKTVILQHGVFANHERGLMDLYWNRSLISYTALKFMLS